MYLLVACERYDLSLTIEYETGRYIPGELAIGDDGKLIPQEEIPPEHIRQGPKGWRVEVAGRSYDKLVDLKTAISQGIGIMELTIKERT